MGTTDPISKECEKLKDRCTKDDDTASCVKYLKKDSCSLCKGFKDNNKGKKEKDKCYKRTGKIYARVEGYRELCDVSPSSVSGPPSPSPSPSPSSFIRLAEFADDEIAFEEGVAEPED